MVIYIIPIGLLQMWPIEVENNIDKWGKIIRFDRALGVTTITSGRKGQIYIVKKRT